MATLKILAGARAGEAVPLESGSANIGADGPGATGCEVERVLARVHWWSDGQYWIEDLHGPTGVRLNGRPLLADRVLEDGDIIAAGEALVLFSSNGTGHMGRAEPPPGRTNGSGRADLGVTDGHPHVEVGPDCTGVPAAPEPPSRPAARRRALAWLSWLAWLFRVQLGAALILFSVSSLLLPVAVPMSSQAVVNARVASVRAPIDGEVASLDLDLGDTIGAGEALAWIRNDRVDRAHLAELATRRSSLQAKLATILDEIRVAEQLRARYEALADEYRCRFGVEMAGRIEEAARELDVAREVRAEKEAVASRAETLFEKQLVAAADRELARMQHATAAKDGRPAGGIPRAASTSGREHRGGLLRRRGARGAALRRAHREPDERHPRPAGEGDRGRAGDRGARRTDRRGGDAPVAARRGAGAEPRARRRLEAAGLHRPVRPRRPGAVRPRRSRQHLHRGVPPPAVSRERVDRRPGADLPPGAPEARDGDRDSSSRKARARAAAPTPPASSRRIRGSSRP